MALFSQFDSFAFTHRWTIAKVNNMRAQFRKGTMRGNYGKSTVDNIDHHLKEHVNVTGKTVLVIGSQV